MSNRQFYPVLLFPDYIEQYLRFGQTSKNKNRYKSHAYFQGKGFKFRQKQLSFQPTAKSNLISLGLLKKIVVIWYGSIYGLTGLISLHFVYQLFGGVSLEKILLWIISVSLLQLILWFGNYLLKQLLVARDKDKSELERIYWQDNRDNNQNYLDSVAAQVTANFRQNRQNFNRPSTKSKSQLKSQLRRGEIKGDAPKGVSEAFLLKHLQQYFPQLEIAEDYYAIEGTEVGYTTDFSLVEPVLGLGIDLEVDEPYEGKFKTPHHCTDNSKDRDRNEFMLAKGWIVLRVSEYQVVHQPESVCKLVAEIFKSVVGGESYLETIFPGVPKLTPDPMWNSVGVKQMISRKYRERYLDKAGIFKYNEQRERQNADAYKAEQKQKRKEAKKRKRANLKAWRQRNQKK